MDAAKLAIENSGGARITFLRALFVLAVILIACTTLVGQAVLGYRDQRPESFLAAAILQADDMAERMRANAVGLAAGAYDDIAGTPTDPRCRQRGCGPREQARLDAREWNLANARLLPGGTGTVRWNPRDGVYTVSMSWDGDHDGEPEGRYILPVQP